MHLTASTLLLGLAAAATNHRVDVGKAGLKFEPNTTTAAVGDTIDFHFYPKNHSVAMGAYDNPCHPVSSGGFFSGYMPDEKGISNITFTIKINSTDPIWIYCTQAKHCESGMVGVINPPSSSSGGDSLSGYASAANSASENVAPASVYGGEIKTVSEAATKTHSGTSSTGTGSATGSTTTTGSATAGSASATSTSKPGAAARLGGGVELGGLVAGVAIAMAVL